MNVFRASLCLAAVAFLAAAPALAQTPTPVEATPSDDWAPRAVNRPFQLQPPGEGGDQVPPPPGMGGMTGVEPRAPKGFQVDELSAVNPDSGGALSAAQGGFGPTLWEGTKRPFVDALLPGLPLRTGSPALRDPMRRLLLSTARAPEGQALPGSLVSTRIRLLSEMGDLDGMASLLSSLPQQARSEPLQRIESESLLLSGETAKACSHGVGQVQHGNLPYWQKLLIFCQTLAGEKPKAALGAELLRESGHEDPGFYLLLEAFGAKAPPAFPGIPNPSALHVAMARAAKVDLPPALAKMAPPLVLRAIARDKDLALDLRALAAERAEATGSLPVQELRDIYAAIPFADEELANPLSAAEAYAKAAEAEAKKVAEPPAKGKIPPKAKEPAMDAGLKARALLVRAALSQKVASARAEALVAAFARAEQDGRFAAAARLLEPALNEIPPSAEPAALAPDAVRALMLLGQRERAGAWYRQLKGGASGAKAAARLKPMLRLAGMSEASDWNPHDIDAWWNTAKDDRNVRDRAALLFGLLEGFDNFVPDSFWDRLASGPATTNAAMPHAALWQRLSVATRYGRLGETVLISLIAIGDDGPAQAHPVVMRQVIAALRAVRLEAEARALAVEAMAVGWK
ncbi:MAG: hypothetical protein H7841_11260 [Magnetospirillum sp. WYHS-4]